MKVFCIGMFKTGTTTLGLVFEQMGFKTFHGPWREIDNDPFDFNLEDFKKQANLLEPILEEYDAFEDYPFMFIYPYLAEKYPKAKFILSERDPIKVAKSDRNMWLAFGRKESEIPQAEVFIKRYLKHNQQVKEFFSDSDRLLCIRVGNSEDLQKLNKFLETGNQSVEQWPHKNKGFYMPVVLQKIYWKVYWGVVKIKQVLVEPILKKIHKNDAR